MSRGSPHLSLVVPMYNESARIAEPLREMAAYLGKLSIESELVLVDDGSADDTSQIVAQEAPQLGLPVRLIRYEENRGKGYALKVAVVFVGEHVDEQLHDLFPQQHPQLYQEDLLGIG